MRIITTNYSLHYRFPIEKNIELIANAGFDGIDFTDTDVETKVWSDSYKDYAKHLLNVADSFGICFTQTHAPITSDLLRRYDGNMQFVTDRICRSIEFAHLLGAEHVVVHPIPFPRLATKAECLFEENMKFFATLVPYAEQFKVKMAIENMIATDPVAADGVRCGACADPEDFKRYIDYFDSDYVTGCLDFGHSAISGIEPQEMLRVMGTDYITSTHIHDNDFINDSHQLPCTMKMNWDEICNAMADIGYTGDFTLEAVCFLNKFSDEIVPDALKFMHSVAQSLTSKIEARRVCNER